MKFYLITLSMIAAPIGLYFYGLDANAEFYGCLVKGQSWINDICLNPN